MVSILQKFALQAALTLHQAAKDTRPFHRSTPLPGCIKIYFFEWQYTG